MDNNEIKYPGESINKNSNITEDILNEIVAFIEKNNVGIDEQLPTEKELCNILNVSRTSVREALRILEFFNLVRSEQGLGRFLANDPRSALKWQKIWEDYQFEIIIEARILIETNAIDLTAKEITKDKIDNFKEIVRELEPITDNKKEFFQTELEFHRLLGKYTNNPLIFKMIDFLIYKSVNETQMFYESTLSEDTPENCIKEFNKIIEYLEKNEPEKAKKVLKKHFNQTIIDALSK